MHVGEAGDALLATYVDESSSEPQSGLGSKREGKEKGEGDYKCIDIRNSLCWGKKPAHQTVHFEVLSLDGQCVDVVVPLLTPVMQVKQIVEQNTGVPINRSELYTIIMAFQAYVIF